MKKAAAIDATLEDLELKAVLLRLSARKFARDIEILSAHQRKHASTNLSPHIRRLIRIRIAAHSDMRIAEQEVCESQEYYLLKRVEAK